MGRTLEMDKQVIDMPPIRVIQKRNKSNVLKTTSHVSTFDRRVPPLKMSNADSSCSSNGMRGFGSPETSIN